MLEAYNEEVLFGNSPGATVQEIALLGLNDETAVDTEKVQILVRGKYLETAFLLSLDRTQYGELNLSFKDNYAKQHKNYPRISTNVYRLIVAFDPMGVTPVAGGCNEGLNFGNVVAYFNGTGNRDHGGDGGTGIKLEC